EPTSGVDPAARDSFWELLCELSRRDGVTIFISTHFMNEAMRCDRISLMHAGRVLVYDTPDGIVEAKGADSLEAAFISYIEDAIGETDTAPEPHAATSPDIASAASKQLSHGPDRPASFSPQRMLAYSYRETKEVMRDPVRLAFAFLGTFALLVIMSYGISMDVEQLTFAAYDQDRTPQSRAYLRNFSGSRYFWEQPEITSTEDLNRRLKSGELTLAIEIPPDFGRSLKRFDVPQVSAWIDGSNTSRAGTLENYVTGAHQAFIANAARETGIDPNALAKMSFEPRYQYNPAFESIYAIGPAIPAMLLLLFPAILMAVSVAREKEIGTITNFYVTPTTRLEFLLGKQLPYIAIALANFVVLTLQVIFVLGVPLKGSLMALSLGALLYAVAATGSQ
ncbi:MAG: ABC transporter permease, partial [Cyanobacteria bacterium J06648_11]